MFFINLAKKKKIFSELKYLQPQQHPEACLISRGEKNKSSGLKEVLIVE